MKSALAAILSVLPAAASAHAGHIGPLGGHSHWEVAALVVGALVATAALAYALARK